MGTFFALLVAYLIGSLSTSIIMSRIQKSPDPRSSGSRNPGASNVLRSHGSKAALLVLIGDALKGLLSIWIAMIFQVHGAMLGIVALAAVIGHCFPLYFKFQGGKGVATALGSLFALSLWTGLITVIVWLVILTLTRYISLASILAIAVSPVVALFFGAAIYFFPLVIIAVFVIWRHRENIQRLKTRSEDQFSLGGNAKTTKPPPAQAAPSTPPEKPVEAEVVEQEKSDSKDKDEPQS